ncbi:hypothetical protein GCM10020227_44880 [Streptomyces flavovirens]
MSGSPRYVQYRGDPPPCDRTHQTPPAPPSGRTALLSKQALGRADDDVKKMSVRIVGCSERPTPGIGIEVVSACYQAPEGQTVDQY